MNYAEQQAHLRQGRIAAICLIGISGLLAALTAAAAYSSTRSIVAFALVVAAVAVSLAYTPDYLHLTVNLKKRVRWEIKIRWRVAAAALLVGLPCASNLPGIAALGVGTAWVIAANLLARPISQSYASACFWLTDLTLVAALLLFGFCGPLVGVGLLVASAHLSIVICEQRPFVWSAAVMVSAWLLLLVLDLRLSFAPQFFLAATGLLVVSAGGAGWLVHRAQQRNTRNLEVALQELMEFTGYAAEKVCRLWSESDQGLAQNWVQAALDENDAEALAQWYRQNSELYMFAISAYNLDYKRIRSNLKVLRFGRGACLDYGAGNGEVILELARRGHPATYYDVDGVSAKFARYRCQKRGLDVDFLHSREALAEAAGQRRFDTVFSLDVLEHLPDLPGQLIFLAGLLNPGGLMLFDVPAGTTRSHPMHLNHQVEVRSLLTERGLREKRTLLQKLPFVKEEKYVFVVA
ncbi:MAG TPA: methyltransferase domain-containing protein [Candidatus Angelobacter sp.]